MLRRVLRTAHRRLPVLTAAASRAWRYVKGDVLRRTEVAAFFERNDPEWHRSVPPTPGPNRRLAFLSAAVAGDNSGDALIQNAIERLVPQHERQVFPLLRTLTGAELEQINASDAAVICGTNLYQGVFACALTPEIIRRIRVPILPLGIGCSAAVGEEPRMNEEGKRAVRMLHERCRVGSTRDPLSYDFVRSLGIKNVEMTGCPVLFHGGEEPHFAPRAPGRVVVAIRARLLHVADGFLEKEVRTLERLCREFKPTLLTQSPYDLEIAKRLHQRFDVPYLHDPTWTARPMLDAVAQADHTITFRLHFGMLALSHGVPTQLIATDTRVSEFCEMMDLGYHHVSHYDDDSLLAELRAGAAPPAEFNRRWRILRQRMQRLLEQNDILAAAEGRRLEGERGRAAP
jgi:polysaccharide pyruvyl transferase WcaK-like protein